MASETATRYGLSRGLLGLKYDRINISDSDSDLAVLVGTTISQIIVPTFLFALTQRDNMPGCECVYHQTSGVAPLRDVH